MHGRLACTCSSKNRASSSSPTQRLPFAPGLGRCQPWQGMQVQCGSMSEPTPQRVKDSKTQCCSSGESHKRHCQNLMAANRIMPRARPQGARRDGAEWMPDDLGPRVQLQGACQEKGVPKSLGLRALESRPLGSRALDLHNLSTFELEMARRVAATQSMRPRLGAGCGSGGLCAVGLTVLGIQRDIK